MILSELGIIILLVLLNGLFAMSEMALVSVRKARLHSEAGMGDTAAGKVLELADSPQTFLSTVQVGITLIGIVAGVYGGATLAASFAVILRQVPVFAPYADPLAYGLVIAFITYCSLILGELFPKRIALAYPEAVAKVMHTPMRLLASLFKPVVWTLDTSTDLLFRLLRLNPNDSQAVTEDEIKLLLSQGRQSGAIEHAEEEIVQRVLRLGDRRAESIMTPRKDLFWIDAEEPLDVIWREASEVSHTLFPVGKGSLENFLGIVYVTDLAAVVYDGQGRSLESAVQEPVKVPSTVSALGVLEALRTARSDAAIVIDEYGGIDGLITLHDVMEAIVGTLPNDQEEEPDYVRREDGSLLVDASMNIDDLFSVLGIEQLSYDDRFGYHSLGGFIMAQVGRVPVTGERLEYAGHRFEVVDMDRQRIDKVLVSRS